MSAQPSPRSRPAPHATPRPGVPNRGDGARAKLTVAPGLARRRLRARLLVWSAALLTIASLFTLVAFHVFAAQSAFTMERLSKDLTNEQLRYERLRLQVAQDSSASVVIAASNKFGMVPGPGVISLTVPATPLADATTTAVTIPVSSGTDYSKAKHALDPTP